MHNLPFSFLFLSFEFLFLGVLEVMPLKFSCLSVSEGSKFDQLKSSTIKSAHKKETNQDPNIFNQQVLLCEIVMFYYVKFYDVV